VARIASPLGLADDSGEEAVDLIGWIHEKHSKLAAVIPVASQDPWTLHGPSHLCISCLQVFVDGYLSDVPQIISYSEVMEKLKSGEFVEEQYG
jgi:hypothetical protein